jgi:hypothetical protein
MALLRTQIVRKVQNQAGSAIANANATIYSLPDNSLATVYTNETGTATYTQPLQSGLDGSFAGWLELGDYSITIASSAGTSTSRYYANHPQQSYLETYGDDVPLTVKAGTALTSNMAEWKDASGTTVMSVSTAGSITSPTVTAIQNSVTAVDSSLGSALGTIGTNTAAIGSVSGTVGTAVTNISNLNSSLGSVAGTVSMGGLVFTNEAARDAAITSPTEGMRVYLTAPTIPAATGGTTVLPTGITTIYNGSVWVCVTPVSAYTPDLGETMSTSYSATLTGAPGTNPSVTLVTGTSAVLDLSCAVLSTVEGVGAFMSVAVSGAGTVAANDVWSVYSANTSAMVSGRRAVITGLTAGTNTFTLQYRQASSATGRYINRIITVQGLA